MKQVSLILILMFGWASVMAQAPDFDSIMKTIDERSNFLESDFSATMSMVTEDPEEGNDKRVVHTFRRDKDDKFLLLIKEPVIQLGQGYLRLEDNLWFYDPESRKFSHTSMKENFQGSDAKNSDFRMWTMAEDYKVNSYTSGKLGAYDVWIVDLEAKHDEVTYPFKKIWITHKDNLVLKTEDYSLTKRLMRTSYYPSYVKVDNSYIADKMIFVDALVKGKKTQIRLSNISTKAIPDYVFTKAYVERVNR